MGNVSVYHKSIKKIMVKPNWFQRLFKMKPEQYIADIGNISYEASSIENAVRLCLEMLNSGEEVIEFHYTAK